MVVVKPGIDLRRGACSRSSLRRFLILGRPLPEYRSFVIEPLMKIRSRSHRQFLQCDVVPEFLQPVDASFGYSLTVAFIKVVSTEIGISLFAS